MLVCTRHTTLHFSQIICRNSFSDSAGDRGKLTYPGIEAYEAVAWAYDDPLRDGEPVRGLVCFFQERDEVEVVVDGEVVESPPTQWSGTDWISRYRRG